MQLVKYTLIAVIRDDEDVDYFFERLEEQLEGIQDITYNISISGQEVKQIDYPDPIDCGEGIDRWTEKSTEVIDEEIERDNEPVFKNPDGN